MNKSLLILAFGLMLNCSSAMAQQKWREMSEDPTVNYYDVVREGETYYANNFKGKGSGYKQFQRWKYFMKNHIDSLGNIRQKDEEYLEIRHANVRLSKSNARIAATGANWKEVGPTYWKNSGGWAPGLGRLEAVRVDEANQNNIYVGSPGGGAWKTNNGGTNWKPITDNITPSALYVWAIGMAAGSPDTVYVGTEKGMLYSYNGGTSFNSATIAGTVRRIEVHPNNHKIVLAATTSGIYKSTDAGKTWTQIKSGTFYDLRFKPDNANVIYACGTSFQKSTDGGNSFTTISMGTSGVKRLAVTAANPNYVYVAELSGQAFGAMYRSTDAGSTFSTRVTGGQNGTKYGGYEPSGNDDAGQGSYNFCLAASPTNAEEVHLGCIITWKSTNGGSSFTATTQWTYPNNTGYTHCDMHQLEYVGNTLYTGSDGGIFKSTDKGDNFTDISKGLGIRMYYKIGQSESDPTMVGGGAQDNGGNLYKNGAWLDWYSADGMNTVIDWSNANIVYGMSQNGTLYKTTNGGASTASITQPGGGAWVNPLAQDTKNSNTIYYGGTSGLYKSTNAGNSWSLIYSQFGQLEEIEVAPSDNNYVYVSKGSTMYLSTNGGAAFTTISTGIAGSVNQIAISPLDAKKVYIATSSGVYYSANAGTTWTNIKGSLPNLSANAIAVDNTADEGIYVAMSYQVYYKNKNLSAWIPFNDNLPLVDIRQLEYHKTAKKVRVGTYGRGIWETAAYNPVESKPDAQFTANNRNGCKSIKVKFDDITIGNVTSRKWTFTGGTPATSTADTVTVSYNQKGTYSVKLIVTNSVGSDTITMNNYITVDDFSAPTSNLATFCNPGESVSLTATKTSGNLSWFASNDTINPLFVGDIYTTNLQQTTKFFVNTSNASAVSSVGPKTNTIGTGASHGGGQSLIFNALKPFTLKTVKVYATGAKARTIQLKDSADNVITEKIVTIPDGENVVTLNMEIPAGNNLKIGLPTGSDLFRNDAGATYPFTVNNVVSITGTTAGDAYPNYYYYFYDWKIQEKSTCASKMVAVTAKLDTCTTTGLTEADMANLIYPNPVYDEVSIKLGGKVKVSINNQEGKLVQQALLINNDKTLNVSELAKGLYTIVLEFDNKKIIQKLIKK